MSKNLKDMDVIEKKEYYSHLFDYYEKLFTEKQIQYFKDYYFYDLTLGEIATNYQVSRSAVFDAISKLHNSLDDYEEKLHLAKDHDILLNICDKYEQLANDENNKLALMLIENIKKNM